MLRPPGALPRPSVRPSARRALGALTSGARRQLGPILLVLTAIVLLAAAAVWSPIAHPRTLEIDGQSGPRASEIEARLREVALEQSTFAVDKSRLMTALAPFPEVADIRVDASPPFRLDLAVVMRRPVARVEVGGRTFVVAADGTMLDRAAAGTVPTIAASISGVQLDGTRLSGAGAALRVLGAAPEVLLPMASSIRDTQGGLEVVMRRGPRILFGDATGADAKWAAAAAVIAQGDAAEATYIDVRVPSRPAVGGLGGTADGEAAGAPLELAGGIGEAAAASSAEQATAPSAAAPATAGAGAAAAGSDVSTGETQGTGAAPQDAVSNAPQTQAQGSAGTAVEQAAPADAAAPAPSTGGGAALGAAP